MRSSKPWCRRRGESQNMGMQNRLDKWLWAMRLFRTRTQAAAACREGRVLIGGQRVKPSREPRVGETIGAVVAGVQRTVKVVGFPPGRVGAKLVPEFMEDLTPAAEFEKAREAAKAPSFAWPKGTGRPTKKNRRLWEKLDGERED
jgi:ribosome-associated heat shock protein Hsp15